MIMRILKNICATSILGLFPLKNGIDGKGEKNRAADARAFSHPLIFSGKNPGNDVHICVESEL